MGMFDYFDVTGAEVHLFTCSNGHIVRGLQTKSLGCQLSKYRCQDGVLTEYTMDFEDGDPEPVASTITDSFTVYNSCEECTERNWSEFVVEFDRGILVAVTAKDEPQPIDSALVSSRLVGSIRKMVDGLKAADRLELIGNYCHGCGSADPRCHCLNDE